MKLLVDTWRAKAQELRDLALESEARVFELCADQLDTAAQEWMTEPLTVAEAKEYSGYSKSQINRLVSSGKVQNVGLNGDTRVRRLDLPVKPGHAPDTTADLAEYILAQREAG